MTDFNQALHLAPHLAFAYHDRAWVKFANDDLPGALDDENAAIEFAPSEMGVLPAALELSDEVG